MHVYNSFNRCIVHFNFQIFKKCSQFRQFLFFSLDSRYGFITKDDQVLDVDSNEKMEKTHEWGKNGRNHTREREKNAQHKTCKWAEVEQVTKGMFSLSLS